MFFFLSKTLGYLVKPLVVICMCFALSWVVRNERWKRRLLRTGMILLLFFSNEFIANECMHAWEAGVTPFDSLTKKYTYGVLLCGIARSEVGPRDRVYLGPGADRINHTLQLYKMGFISKVLVSGGSGRLIDNGDREADELASLLRLMGVPDTAILIENNSNNTRESALEVKKMLQPITTSVHCLLITSASHIPRASACFRKVGFPMDHFAVDFQSHRRKYTFDVLIIPKMEAVGMWGTLLKEWTGYLAYKVAGYV